MAAIRNQKLEPDAGRDGCRAENLQVNRAVELQIARIAASPRDISQPKRVSFCCLITLRAQRALFSVDAGDLRSNAGNPVSHAPLVHATRTLPADADAHRRDLFTGRESTFDPSATVQDPLNSARVPAVITPLTRPVSNQCARVHRVRTKVCLSGNTVQRLRNRPEYNRMRLRTTLRCNRCI